MESPVDQTRERRQDIEFQNQIPGQGLQQGLTALQPLPRSKLEADYSRRAGARSPNTDTTYSVASRGLRGR